MNILLYSLFHVIKNEIYYIGMLFIFKYSYFKSFDKNKVGREQINVFLYIEYS